MEQGNSALHTTVECFAEKYEAVPTACFVMTADGRICWFNTAFAALSALHTGIGVPKDLAARCAEVITAGTPNTLAPTCFPRPGEAPRWAAGELFPLRGDALLAAGILVEVPPVSAKAGELERNNTGRVVNLNPASPRAAGGLLDEAAGRPLHQRIPHQCRMPADGEEVERLRRLHPLPAADDPHVVRRPFIDVGEQRQARDVVSFEQRYHAIFDHADVSILQLDCDARIVDANPAFLRMTGFGIGELRGRFAGAVITRGDVTANDPYWTELMAARRNRYDLPVTIRRAGGRRLAGDLTVTVIRDRRGCPTGAFGILPLCSTGSAEPLPAESVPTPGEADVLVRLAEGRTNGQIAAELNLTRRGVDYRIARLHAKLRGADGAPGTVAGLVARAYATGLLRAYQWPPAVAEPSEAPLGPPADR